MRTRITRLYQLGWDACRLPPPHLWPGDRRQIAARAWDQAGLERGADPRHLAVRLGFRVYRLDIRDCGGECTDGYRIVYRPHPNRFVEQLHVAHGLAHALLQREAWDHSETDALFLTADLAPAESLGFSPPRHATRVYG